MPPQPQPALPGTMLSMPSITSNPEDLRRRRAAQQQALREQALSLQRAEEREAETALKAAVTARLLPPTDLRPLGSSRQRKGPPLAQPTGALFVGEPLTEGPEWGVRTGVGWCGLSKLKWLTYTHGAAMIMHLAFFVASLIVGSESPDPYITVYRQQMLFTRRNMSCSLADFVNATDDERPLSILVPNEYAEMNVVALTASFFALSALMHGVWTLGVGFYDPLGRVLLDWLDAAWSPLRWIEYAISAPLQFTVLLLASGDRLETDISSTFMLLSTTMVRGGRIPCPFAFCEHPSVLRRPLAQWAKW